MVDLSAEEADALYGAPKSLLGKEPIRWIPSPQHARGLIVEVPVVAEDGTELEVRGWYTPGSRKCGFSLLYKGVPVRRWDVHRKNRDVSRRKGPVVEGPHKHKHNPEGPDPSDVYPVTDITTSDAVTALRQFLAECKVDTRGALFEGLI